MMNMRSSLRYFESRDLIVAIHNAGPCSDEEWNAYLKLVSTYTASGRDRRRLLGLTLTDGGAPNTLQRKRLLETVEMQGFGKGFKGVVVSDNALIRGVVTAIGWVKPGGLRCFAPTPTEPIFEYLDLRGGEAARCLVDIGDGAREIGCSTHARMVDTAKSRAPE